MADEEIKFHPDDEDEEYQFNPDVESLNRVYEEPSKPPGFFEKINRKFILLVLGIALAIIFIYRWLSAPVVHLPWQKAINPSAQTTNILPADMARPPVVATTIQPAAQNIPADSQVSMQISAEQKNIDRLNQQMNQLQSALDELKTQLNTQFSSITANIEDLSTQLTALQKAQKASAAQALRKKKAAAKAAPKPVYYLRSAISGRAWLSTSTGETLTVAVGDEVPGYGTVVNIDPVQGLVTLSTGSVIGFSPSEA